MLIWLVALSLLRAAPANDLERLDEAARWIRDVPLPSAEHRYVMTARLRLLFFWVGRDDVGGGYIRFGVGSSDPRLETIELLFGSDPAKAPRRINRWGAATEVRRRSEPGSPRVLASALFGFMKTSKGQSVGEMERELAREKIGGNYHFEAIVSRVEREGAISRVVPFASPQDFNLHQLDEARAVVFDRLSSTPAALRRLPAAGGDCQEPQGFLFTVKTMVDAALDGRPGHRSVCYVYNARRYTLTLVAVERVPARRLRFKLHGEPRETERDYRNLLGARFTALNHERRQSSHFELLLGTEGELRGVPVQITHQPNWWFKVVLNRE